MPAPTLDQFAALAADDAYWKRREEKIRDVVDPIFRRVFEAGATAALRVRPRAEKAAQPILDLPAPRERYTLLLDRFAARVTDTERQAVFTALETAKISGTGVGGVIDDIKPYFGSTRATAVAVTETTAFFGAGATARYIEMGLRRWEWSTVRDPWVCPRCQPLDANQFSLPPAADAIEFSPEHVQCRCFPVPVGNPEAVPPSQYPAGGFGNTRLAEQFMTSKYPGIRFNFGAMNPRIADRTMRELDRLLGKYPPVRHRLKEVISESEQFTAFNYDNVYAYATRDGHIINMNPKYYADAEDTLAGMIRNDASALWHPVGTENYESVVSHEFGHQVHNWLNRIGNSSTTDYVGADGAGTVNHLTNGVLQRRTRAGKLSEYAKTSEEETFAEAFAQRELAPRSQWSPMTKDVNEVLNRVGDGSRLRPSARGTYDPVDLPTSKQPWEWIDDAQGDREEALDALADIRKFHARR